MTAMDARQPRAAAGSLAEKQGGRLAASIAGVLLGLFCVLAISSSLSQSPTIDEPVHLLGGYSYLKWGDYRVNPEHPPLAKMWAALPLLWMDLKDPRPGSTDWDLIARDEHGTYTPAVAHQMFFVRNDAETLFFWARLQMVVISLALGCFVFHWGRQIFGAHAALVATFLFCFDPNIIAHSAVIHSDLAFAAFFFLSVYFFWRIIAECTWPNVALACLSVALAAATKHSFVAIFPVWLALGLLGRLSRRSFPPGQSDKTRRRAPAEFHTLVVVFLCAAIVSYASIWAVYGFRYDAVPGHGQPLGIIRAPSSEGILIDRVKTLVADHRLLPEASLAGHLYNLMVWKRNAYLLGRVSESGFWSYFPIAFVAKTPLPTVLLCLTAIALWVRNRRRHRSDYLLVLPVLVYFLLAVYSRFNIGVRHLLPIYPFLFVWLGGVAEQLWREGRYAVRVSLLLLAMWYLASSLAIYPHYLSYFSEVVGGPHNGHRILLDSNLDWGQDLKGLKKWLNYQGTDKVQLVYFGIADPKYYGIDDFYSPENVALLSKLRPHNVKLPEYLAISANFLYGGRLYLPPALSEAFRRYRFKKPTASIGYSLLVFKLDPSEPEIYNDTGVVFANKEALSAAEILFAQTLRMDPRNARAHFNLARALTAQKRLDEAETHYREGLAIDPESAEAHHDRGRNWAAQGKSEAALEEFAQALRLKPDFVEAHESLSRLFRRQGRIDEAIKHSQEALRLLRLTQSKPQTP